jgi:hypothetical protein
MRSHIPCQSLRHRVFTRIWSTATATDSSASEEEEPLVTTLIIGTGVYHPVADLQTWNVFPTEGRPADSGPDTSNMVEKPDSGDMSLLFLGRVDSNT